MIEATRLILSSSIEYFINDAFFLIFIAAFIYLFFFEKRFRKLLLYPALAISFVILNPVLYELIYKRVLLYAYWRILWLIPVIPVIFTALCCLIQKCTKTLHKLAVFLVLTCVVMLGGSNLYTGDLGQYAHFERAPNAYKTPQDANNVADALLKLSDSPKALVPSALVSYIRQYAGEIQIMYGRTGAGGTYLELLSHVLSHLESDFPNYLFVHNAMKSHGYEYLVCPEGRASEDEMRQCGFIKRDSVDDYGIYELDQQLDFSQSGWQLSRFTSLYDENIVYYTLTSALGELMVIHSSLPQEAYYFKTMINQYPGISAWIITNPAAAENSALQWIVENQYDITIDHVYKAGVNSFDDILEQNSSVTHLKEGDKLPIGKDLTLEALSISDGSNGVSPGTLEFRLAGKKNAVHFAPDSMPEGITVIH